MEFIDTIKRMYTKQPKHQTSDGVVLGGECITYQGNPINYHHSAGMSKEMAEAHELADSLLKRVKLAEKEAKQKIKPMHINQTESFLKYDRV